MAGKDLTYRIGIDASDATGSLQRFGREVKGAMRQLEDGLGEGATAGDKLSAALDQLTAQMKEDFNSAAIAAEEMGRALKEAGSTLDAADVVTELSRMGISFDEMTADADKLAASLKQMDDVKMAGVAELDAAAPGLATKLDAVSKSADSSKNALANMIGNSVQDVSGLGGAMGVAAGQMAEFAADAKFSGEGLGSIAKNMAGVLGPMLGIAAAAQTVSGYMQIQADRAAEAAARVDMLGEAMEGATDDARGLADSFRESMDVLEGFEATELLGGEGFVNTLNDIAKSLPIIGGLAQDVEVDLVSAFTRAGTNVYAFSDAITGTVAEGQAFLDLMYAQFQAGKITGDEYVAMAQAVVQYRDASAQAATQQKFTNVGLEEANALIEEAVPPLEQYTDKWATLMADMADGKIDTQAAADAMNFLAANLGLTADQVRELAQGELDEQMQAAAEQATALAEGMDAVAEAFDGTEARMSALSDAFGTFNADSDLAFSEMATNTVASFDDIKEALGAVQDIGSKPLVPTTIEDLRGLSDESAAVVDALGGMRDAIQTELGVALADAGGNFDAFREKAGFFREQVTEQFTAAFEEMGLGPAEVEDKVTELLGTLGLLPSQVETVIKLTQQEEAIQKIELFGDALSSLPAEVQAKVAAAIDENDPIRAWELINAGVQAQGAATVNIDADHAAALAKADEAKMYADGLVGTETVAADTAPFTLDADAAKTYADGLVGTETIDGENTAAKASADDAKSYADSLKGFFHIDGDNKPAKSSADAAKSYADGLNAAITIDAQKGSGWDSLKNFFAGGITATVNAKPKAAPATAATGPTVGPTALVAAPTSTPGAVTPFALVPVSAAATQVAAIWEDILRAVNRLGTLAEEGNNTAELASRALKAIDLADVSAVQANRIGSILEQLNYETVAGNKEAMAALSTELSIAVRELNPAAAAGEPAATGEVVKPTEVKVKEDPNTPILLKISDTLLTMLSHDRTALAMTLGELNAIAHADQTAAAAHAAAMTIRAGAA